MNTFVSRALRMLNIKAQTHAHTCRRGRITPDYVIRSENEILQLNNLRGDYVGIN